MVSRPPAPSVRKTGPVSRIQQSSTGMSPITVTAEPHIERALATLAGLAHMVTGSYFAIVLAISAMSDWTPASLLRQMPVLSGQAIQVRVWRRVSIGTRKPAAAARSAPVLLRPAAAAADPPVATVSAVPAAARPATARNRRRSRLSAVLASVGPPVALSDLERSFITTSGSRCPARRAVDRKGRTDQALGQYFAQLWPLPRPRQSLQ